MILPTVFPVVRPLFFTSIPIAASRGGPGLPISMILPKRFTLPLNTCASAASIRFGASKWIRTNVDNVATLFAGGATQLESIKPGWLMFWPIIPRFVFARTWLLLRRYRVPPTSFTSAPSVPEQQNCRLESLVFPPEVPRRIGRFCFMRWFGPLSEKRPAGISNKTIIRIRIVRRAICFINIDLGQEDSLSPWHICDHKRDSETGVITICKSESLLCP